MSQDKRSQPAASAGQGQNIFSLYGYRPQFPANTLVTDQPVQKEGTGSQPGGQGGNMYFSQLISEASQAGGQQQQSCVSASAVPQPQACPPPSPQQPHAAQVAASGLLACQAQQPVGQGFACGISNLTSVSTPNSASFHAAAAHPTSVSSVQAARGIERQSAGMTTNKWPAQQFSPYQSSGQVGVSASRSLLAGSHIVVQPASTLSQAPEMSLSASLYSTANHSLIQQGLLANPLYSQGSVSSVGPMTVAHPHSLSQTAPTPLASSMNMFPPAGQVTSSTSQAQPPVLGQGYSQGGKRKSSSPGSEGDLTPVQCDGKQPRTAGDGRTVWDIGRPGGSVSSPMTSAQMSAQSAPHTNSSSSGRGWSGSSTTANSSSGFMDTFRSFVETSSSQGAYSQQKGNRNHQANPVVREDPGSAVNMSQHTVATSAGSQEGYRFGERPAQPQSQSFVEKIHATIFSLSEEVSTSAAGVGEGDVQQSISGANLASILKTVGKLDASSHTHTRPSHPHYVSSSTTRSSECSSSCTSHTPTIGQKTATHMDCRKSSPSPVLHSPQSDGQRAVKSEEKGSASDAAADDHLHRSSASASPDGTASSDSEIESELSSTSSKKRPKSSNASTASKKSKTEKMEPVTQAATKPCVSGGGNKKRAKGTKNTTKVWAWDRPLVRVSVATLKRTGAPFLQNGPCSDLPTKVSKCSECRLAINQGNSDPPSIFCRFYAFRRLKYHPVKGSVMKAGFSELSDADPDHIEPWLPKYPMEDPQLDKDMAKFILSKVGDKFCELVQQEKEAKSLPGADATVVWKRAVTGVREMCDVCETTIFNMHWVCSKCGYVVCLDCYKAKVMVNEGQSQQGEAYRKWQICTSSRYPHDASKLILTQIIPSDALWELGRMIHDIRRKWSIPTACPCGQGGPDPAASKSLVKMLNGLDEDSKLKTAATAQQPVKKEPESPGGAGSQMTKGPQAVKKEGVSRGVEGKQDGGGGSQKLGGCTSLRELLTKTAGKGRVGLEKKPKPTAGSSLSAIIQSVVEKSCRDLGDSPPHAFKFLHYIPRLGQWTRELPIVAHSLTETSVLYPDVPHSWLCDGRLLRLHEPHHRGNLQIFQEQWKRGQPVMVSCVHKLVMEEQWKPASFSQQFGHKMNDLINCHNGDVLTDHPMKDFWGGFESIENRLVDEKGQDLMLKLKDWPPGDDFAELLPSHFNDLMAALPLPEYTRRDGKLNLASRLPEFLVRPDLGPKMYNAFGSAKFPKEATTNLHLDISDAVNVLVYVGVPSDGPYGKKEHEEAAVKSIDEAGCDNITKRRVREVHELPGALWQIYDAHDADKIRDFLNKVAKERGEEIEPNHDPIHDQSWYLDEVLRDRLLKEYGVHGYTIVQCLGDSIFIPAGAPHQVRNLHSCIKVAEDFVSPEHLNHCFRLTQEFRQLSDTHSNHEDKLQVKNIIYHAVKDSIAVLREMDPDDEQ